MSELRIIAQHSGTVLVGQLAVMAFGVADTIVAGRYSVQALAALSVGSAVYATVFVALLGTMQALLPTWAHLHGANRYEDVGRSVRQGLYLAAFALVTGAWVLLFPEGILRWTEVPATLQHDVRGYLGVLTLALPPALLFRMFSTLNQSLGKPVLVTWLQAAGVRFAPGGIRKGAAGYDVTFIHPKGNDQFPIGVEGVLIELVQAPPEVVRAFTTFAALEKIG